VSDGSYKLQNKRTTRRSGFTLVELIIAAAVTSIILSAIAGLFVLALRTVKSGNAAMDANELTRAAFAVMERDLNSAFTSREHGELFHFHGNEVGMSFIGLSRTYDSTSNSEVVQLGRVTYVINPSLNALSNGLDDDGDSVVDNAEESAFDLIYMEVLDTATGDMVDAILPGETLPGVRTVSLIRYFEPGIETLDEYDPLIKDEFDAADLEAELGTPPETASDLGRRLILLLDALDLDDVKDAHLINEVTRSFRRDAYIRMLANASDLDPLNGSFPVAWDLLEPPRDPYDYVIAENIFDLDSQNVLAGGDPTPFLDDEIQRFPYFLYGRVAELASSQRLIEYTTTWNANANVAEIVDNFTFDVLLNQVVTTPEATPWDQNNFGGIGTPLQARLPEIVRVRLPFVFDSPYAGAPHLQRELVQDIRVPSALTRRRVNPLAGI